MCGNYLLVRLGDIERKHVAKLYSFFVCVRLGRRPRGRSVRGSSEVGIRRRRVSSLLSLWWDGIAPCRDRPGRVGAAPPDHAPDGRTVGRTSAWTALIERADVSEQLLAGACSLLLLRRLLLLTSWVIFVQASSRLRLLSAADAAAVRVNHQHRRISAAMPLAAACSSLNPFRRFRLSGLFPPSAPGPASKRECAQLTPCLYGRRVRHHAAWARHLMMMMSGVATNGWTGSDR